MPPCLKYLRMHLCILDFPNKMKQKKKSKALLDTLTALCFVWETIHMDYKSHTINKSPALEQQEEDGDRKGDGWQDLLLQTPQRVKRKKKQWGCRRWEWDGKGIRSRQSSGQGRALPAARAASAPGPGRDCKPGRDGKRETQLGNRQREEKPLKASHWTWVCLPRSREGTRMARSKALREGRQGDGRAQQSRAGGAWAAELQPHRNSLGSALRHRFLAPLTLLCGLPVKSALRNCCFSSQFLPTTSGQEWGSKHRAQRIPWDTRGLHPTPHCKFNF